VGAASLVLVSSAPAAEPTVTPLEVTGVPMEVATEGLTVEEMAAHSAELTRWLSQERPAGVTESPVRVVLTPEQLNSIEFPVQVDGEPLQVGLVVDLTSRVSVQGLGTSGRGKGISGVQGGTLVETIDGGNVWSVAIVSENAGGIRVLVERVNLPEGVELYFYSQNGEAYGPFTGLGPDGNGAFWTPSVFGSEGILQLRASGDSDTANVTLSVTKVGHIGRGVFGLPEEAGNIAAVCSTNASCVVNAECAGANAAVDPARLAVAKMLWVAGGFIYTCSGGLIADNVAGEIPYFLTANHCLSKANTNLEAFFQYRFDSCTDTSNCTGTWTDPAPGTFAGKTVGATVKKTNRKGDYTLLQLSQTPPAGSVYLGWNSVAVSNVNNTPLYRISHPSGAPQCYSTQNVSTSAPTCTSWPRGERIYSRGVTNGGATEGGSSGSPILNASSQIVGQLSGSCGTNNSNVCDNVNNATVDGAFAYYYSAVKPFLCVGCP
jgi:hypothetical protein